MSESGNSKLSEELHTEVFDPDGVGIDLYLQRDAAGQYDFSICVGNGVFHLCLLDKVGMRALASFVNESVAELEGGMS